MKEETMSQHDRMTKTPIIKLLVKLSIPTVITMLITSLYNMADTAFCGRLGTSASGAVGVIFGFMSVLQAIGFFFGQGCGSLLSRELGAKENEKASRTGSTGFFMCLFTSIIVAVVCWIFKEPLIEFLGSTPTIAPYARVYISYILIATPFIVPSFTLNNILRYEGKATLGAIAMMTGAVLNILGDVVFMFILDMGIAGAGLSTAISQIIGFTILISMFIRKKTETRLSIKLITFDFGKILNIMGTGFPSLLRQCLGGLSVVALNYVSKPYGDAAISAMSIVARISMFVFSVVIGIGQGFQPISSFNFGAMKYGRVREAYRESIKYSEILIVVISVIVIILAPWLIQQFRDDPQVVEYGTRALYLQMGTLILMPYSMMAEMLLQTTGKKGAASFLSSIRSGIFFIPILFLLAKFRGFSGIQEAQPISNVLSVIPTIILVNSFWKNVPKEDKLEDKSEDEVKD